jgi:hypothetical protein
VSQRIRQEPLANEAEESCLRKLKHLFIPVKKKVRHGRIHTTFLDKFATGLGDLGRASDGRRVAGSEMGIVGGRNPGSSSLQRGLAPVS